MYDIDQSTPGERAVVIRLIKAILAEGNTISVHDGEEWALKRSSDLTEVELALASTDQDLIHATNPAGRGLGQFHIVWGNAEDGSELIADHSDNAYCNAIWHSVFGTQP